ncbi:MAG: WhiB family transcriptional regulator [Microthrixaceae bacterium]
MSATTDTVTLPVPERAAWEREAACVDLGPDVTATFFSDHLGDIAKAQAICATCPVMAECLEAALARHEPWGIWGGQLLSNGRIVTAKRRRGRPSKHLKVGDQMNQLPLPERLRGAAGVSAPAAVGAAVRVEA